MDSDEGFYPTPDDLAGGEVISHARKVMRHWTGTNCTFVDDDITALGILAGKAIATGLHRCEEIPPTMVKAIDDHIAQGTEAGTAKTVERGLVHDGPVGETDAPKGRPS